MTALQTAKSNLDNYVRELITHPETRLDLGRLHDLEEQIARAGMDLEAGAQF